MSGDEMSDKKIVKNESSGYGYKYASLADMARQGIEIPQMRTVQLDSGDEYIEYLDSGNWVQGAKVVPIESKGMNAAQAYGASLTYARRYTVALARGIVTDDDDKIELDRDIRPAQHAAGKPAFKGEASQAQIGYIIAHTNFDTKKALQDKFGDGLKSMSKAEASAIIRKIKEGDNA
jgi:hypothetical protein